jgi:hypothetical protein
MHQNQASFLKLVLISLVLTFRRKKAIEIEMEEIKPLVEEAKQAVGNIKASTLSEIRSLRAPPGNFSLFHDNVSSCGIFYSDIKGN